MSPRAQNEVVEILSAADASVGWCVMIGSDAGFYSAFLEEGAARALYPDLDMVTAGMLQPAGRALRVPGGYRVSGRWSFGSGSTHADVIIGGCLVFDGDQPVLNENGLPRTSRDDGAGRRPSSCSIPGSRRVSPEAAASTTPRRISSSRPNTASA